MKKLIMVLVAAVFSFSAAAHACDGMKHAKAGKGDQVVKKDSKDTKKDDKKS